MKHALALGLVALSAACSSVDASNDDSTSTSADLATVPVPDQIDRPGRTVTSNMATSVKYYGGRVIPNAKVYVVWWGDGSNLLSDVTKPVGGIADFFTGVLDSAYLDSLAEYSTNIATQAGSKQGSAGTQQLVGRGNYAGTIALRAIPSGNVTDDQIQQTIESAINAGSLPVPDDNTLYAIFFPRSVRITLDGSSSCIYFGAYHYSTPANQHHAAYAVMPDCGYSYSGVTSVTSHELVEAITDAVPTPGSNPDFPQAWNTSDGNEVGDLCTSSSGRVSTSKGTFNVQGVWDESSHGCKVTHTLANDFNVGATGGAASLTAGAATTLTFQTGTTAGSAQPLTLAVLAPPGVTATLGSTTVTSGEPVTVTVTAAAGITVTDGQVVLQATSSGGAVHSAAQLVHVASN